MNISASNTQSERRFCSVISKANGEDTIGTAGTYDRWFIFELSPPWSEKFWEDFPMLHPMLAIAQQQFKTHQLKIRPLAIAPDREYSSNIPSDCIRLIYYFRPDRLFARFDKREYIIPIAQISQLATALLTDSPDLKQFESYRQATRHVRELLVCTHGNVDVACARFGYPIYQHLRSHFANEQLRVWQCSHFGGHRFAPTLIDLPEGRYWGHLEPKILENLVRRQGDIRDLYRFYRGWSGLTQIEQIAEREMWMQQGWKWVDYLKSGCTIAMDEQERNWADVRVEFSPPDGSFSGRYDARIEAQGQVETLGESSDEELVQLKQYRVTRLN
jgi:hypothetical protein